MKDEKNNLIPFPAQPREEQSVNPPQLQIAPPVETLPVPLIIDAIKCIDVAAQRGAYQGGELSTIGCVRDALYNAISQYVEQQPEDAPND